MKRKLTDKELDNQIAKEGFLNRKERRMIKYRREMVKDILTQGHYTLLQDNQPTHVTKHTQKSSS